MSDAPRGGLLTRPAVVSADLLAGITARAAGIDGDAGADGRGTLRALAADGALDLGLVGSGGSYADQARVLADLSAVCMTTAFGAWAHRMTTEYLVVHGGDRLAGLAEELRRAERPGATALAGTFRAASGAAGLPVSIRAGTADGFIPWASNLYDDALVVTGAADGDLRVLIALDRSSSGVEVLAVAGLLALDASRSGSIRFAGAHVPTARVLAAPFDGFVDAVRPTFLLLQSALALGLASASLAALDGLAGPAVAMEPHAEAARAELARLAGQLDAATRELDLGHRPPQRAALRLRLDASHLATSSTQLELAVRGGSAYASRSATARRVREALFLPVQSPTEVQLQWELGQSS